MKKYLFMLAAFAAITAMLSCCKTPSNDGGDPTPPTPGTWVVKSATYYGEKVGKNVGFYSIVMENDKDEFRFDFFSTKITDFKPKIKPLSGDYTKADQSELTRGTYFVALNADDEHGTIYTENGTPVLITDGTVKLNVAAGGYTIDVNLKAGEKEIKMSYNGNFTFVDKHTEPPFDKIAIDYAGIAYIGEYLESQDQLGLISLKLGREDNPREYMQIGITIPFPKTVEEASKIQVPVGVFPVELRPNTPGKVVSGRYEKTGPLYSWWLMTKAITGGEAFNGGIPIEGGTLTIEKAGDKYKITTNFSGRKYSSAGNPQDTVNNVVYYMNEPQAWFKEYIDDFTNPVSTLTKDVEINNLTKIYLDNDGFLPPGATTSIVLWRIVLASEGLAFSLNPANVNEIYVNGTKGDALGVQVLTSTEDNVPLTNYPVDSDYEAAKASVTLPASAGIYDLLGVGSGTFYLQIDNSSVVGNAGACKGKGFVNMLDAGNGNITISFELYDKFGYKMSGSVTAPMVDLVKSTRSNASHYIPTTSIISLFNSGVKDIQ